MLRPAPRHPGALRRAHDRGLDHQARVVNEEADGVRVLVVATVGLGAPVAAGVTPPVAWQPSTINVVAVLDAHLDRGAAVNGVITVTEAKVGALADAGS